MLILYFHKTYYPDPAMAIPVGMTRRPHERHRPGRHRTEEDMSPSNPLTDNVIGSPIRMALGDVRGDK